MAKTEYYCEIAADNWQVQRVSELSRQVLLFIGCCFIFSFRPGQLHVTVAYLADKHRNALTAVWVMLGHLCAKLCPIFVFLCRCTC